MIAERLADGRISIGGTLPLDPAGLMVAASSTVSGDGGRVVAVYLSADDVVAISALLDDATLTAPIPLASLLGLISDVLP